MRRNRIWSPPTLRSTRSFSIVSLPILRCRLTEHVCRTIGNPLKKVLVLVSILFGSLINSALPSHAACTSTQLSQIRQLETRLQQDQRTLSRENEFLSKSNIKINDLQQKLSRYQKSTSSQSLAASTQRQLDSAIREQGQALRKVANAQKWYDMTYNNLTNAQKRCS